MKTENFKVKQIHELGSIIEKKLSLKELTELGFFPLDSNELEELKTTGRVSICGSHKFTIIEPITHAVYYLDSCGKPQLKVFLNKEEATKFIKENYIGTIPSPYYSEN